MGSSAYLIGTSLYPGQAKSAFGDPKLLGRGVKTMAQATVLSCVEAFPSPTGDYEEEGAGAQDCIPGSSSNSTAD